MKRQWAEQFRFFSNRCKENRELWVVHEFLTRLNLSFSESELSAHPQTSKTDVEFREASFQVKEITDPNFRRGDEIKAIYRRVMVATTLQETIGPGFVYDVPPVISGYALVRDTAVELAASPTYVAHKTGLDLLCYVTRTRSLHISEDQVEISDFSTMGWRSVSCLIAERATVLYAATDAPGFLRAKAPEFLEDHDG